MGRAKPRTVLIDSVQLESGEALSEDFKKAAAQEIDTFKAEYRQRYPRCRCREAYGRGSAPRGDEHGRQARQAWWAGEVCGVGFDAYRGLGCQYRQPHPRHPGLR